MSIANKEFEKQEFRLFSDISRLIDESRRQIAASINTELTILYWKIGNRINSEILENTRAEYGRQIVVTVSRQLQNEFGSAFWKRIFIV